jgi:hypothetical protein
MLSFAAFESIDVLASPESVEAWTAKEEHAQRERVHDVTVMDIYNIKMKRCEYDQSMIVLPNRLISCYSSVLCRNTSRVDGEGDRWLWPKGACCMGGQWIEDSGDTV